MSLLCLASCLGAEDRALFDDDGGSKAHGAASAAGATSSGAQSGTDSGASAGSAGSGASAGSVGASGGSSGSGGSSAEPIAGAQSSGGTGPQIPVITDCAMLEGAVTSDINGHCYRVNESELTFAEARDACQKEGGHLVTISSEAEDDFAEALHDGEHWIGASDGLADTMSGVGTYTWVVDEPFDYTDWEEGQPNAFETDCPDADDDADCFEHCAFQSEEGDWNDRSCWHTIVSICEWDIEGGGGALGDAGAPSEP
jgi:hypothetical protein